MIWEFTTTINQHMSKAMEKQAKREKACREESKKTS